MNQPTEEILRALVSLQAAHPEAFKVLIEWIQVSWMSSLVVSCRAAEDVQSRWLQGRCQELEDLSRFVLNAKEQLDKNQAAAVAAAKPMPNKFD
jgi:hypothetical protein